MPILELFPKPAQSSDPAESPVAASSSGSGKPGASTNGRPPATLRPPVKVRTGRYGELEEHELIHLLDSLDDERSRARFRESVYISLFFYLALAWFLLYGPRVLWHQPVLRDPIAMMKQRDKELTFISPSAPAPKPPTHPLIDRKTMQQLQQQQARQAPPTPQPPAPQPTPPPEEAHNTAPPVPQPPMPLPAAPKASPSVEAPLPAAPKPSFAQNNSSAHDAIQNAMRGAMRGPTGADLGSAPGAGGPLQAGAQILSDTGDWDPNAYMRRLKSDIQRNWDPLIPEEVQAPLLKKGIVGIRFVILRDGEIGDIKLETTSGDVALDRAAWNAITSEGQFQALPKEYHGQTLDLRIGFFYNEPIRQ
jgi:outer membrane biosynthesis protein TonB